MALIKIDPEFGRLIPKLQPEEYALLEANLRREGCRDPLRQWGDLLLDGHNRYRICKKFDIPSGTTPIELPDRAAARLWIEENQLGRRNLTDDQRAIIAARAATRLEERSKKERAAAAGRIAGNGRVKKSCLADTVSAGQNERPQRKARAVEKVGKKYQVPERKVRYAQEVEKAAPELAKKVLDGEMPLLAARREIHQDDSPTKERSQSLKEHLPAILQTEEPRPLGCPGMSDGRRRYQKILRQLGIIKTVSREMREYEQWVYRIAMECRSLEELSDVISSFQEAQANLSILLHLWEEVKQASVRELPSPTGISAVADPSVERTRKE
jgi:hypothetical protein